MKKNTSLPFDVRSPDGSKSSCIKCQRYRINTQPAQNTGLTADILLKLTGAMPKIMTYVSNPMFGDERDGSDYC